MGFPLLKRRHDFSTTSSSSLSPTIPVLESPATYQALTTKTIPEATLKQKSRRMERAAIKPSMFLEEKEDDDAVAPHLTRGVPTDVMSVRIAHKSIEEEQTLRTKTQYYEEKFSTRGPLVSPRTQVSQDSVVVVEIKTNTRVRDGESKLVSDITFRLAQIYQKPESFMLVTIQQEVCLHFGNSPLPAYLIKVFALPYLIAPITNLRNTILIQAALQDLLHIAPIRGVVLYIPVSEENFATNGATMMGELARLERHPQDPDAGILRSISRSMSRRMKSSSTHSVPLSLATTSSWAPGLETQRSDSATTEKTSQSKDVSGEEGKSQSIKKPKSLSLRHFVTRRLSELGSLGEVQ